MSILHMSHIQKQVERLFGDLIEPFKSNGRIERRLLA